MRIQSVIRLSLLTAVAAVAPAQTITTLQSSVVPALAPATPANITSIAGGTPIIAFRLYINGTFAVGAVPTVNWVNNGPGNPANRQFVGTLVNANLVTVDIPATVGAAAPINIFANPVAAPEAAHVSVTQGANTSNTADFTIVPQMSALALPDAVLGVPYSAPFVTGGTQLEAGGYGLSDTSGIFPPGITPDFSGSVAPFTNSRLVGTATAAGLYTPRVFPFDFWGNSAVFDLSIRVVTTPTVSAPASSAGSPFPYGTPTTLSTHVAGNPLPTGTVTFFDGAVPLGAPAALDGNGNATLGPLIFSVGAHNNLTAVYSGDTVWAGATSPASAITVVRADPTISVIGAPFSATYGGTLSNGSFSVTGLSVQAAAPSGNVTTSIGGIAIKGSNGTFANVPLGGTALPATITANQTLISFAYSGDANYNAAAVNAAIAIARATPGTAVSFSLNPVGLGANEAITASVTTGIAGAVPTGTVTFLDGGNAIPGAVALTAGSATLNIGTLGVGSHSISFDYSGDVNFAALASGASNLNVTQGTPTVSAPSSSAGATFTYGTTTNLQSTVTANPQATGTVQFFDGVTSLGTANLVAGTATLNNVLLGGGVHNNLNAVYSGDANWSTATSPATAVTVNRATPTLPVTGAPFSAVYGGTLSAGSFSVVGPGGATAAPTGTVVTSIGGINLLSSSGPFVGAVPVTGIALPATVAANQTQITFTYSGDINYLATSTLAAIAIARANPATSVGLNPNPVAVGANEAITASVTTGIAGAVPTGTVTFLDGGNAISGAVALTAGSATLNISTLGVGSHSISFNYNGDVNFAGLASGASNLNVTQGTPTVSAPSSSAGATFVYGTTTNLQSTVTPANPQATGTVQFFDGVTSLGTVNLVAGTATLNNVLLGGGVHNNLKAVYSGDGNWTTATSPAATVTVDRATPTLSVAGAPFSAVYGGPLSGGTFQVSGAGGAAAAPGGSVTTSIGGITILTSNGPFAGSVQVGGTVLPGTVTTNQVQISFAYSGDANYNPVNTVAAIVISRATPGTSVGLNPNPVGVGANEAITASVTTGIAGAVPTGSVTFLDGGNAISGALALAGGSATLNINTLTAGNHSISFTYTGDNNFAGAASGASNLTVTQGTPTVSAPGSSAGAAFVYGTTTNLQSTVTPANPQATGTVQFFDGVTSLGTVNLVAGTATLNNVLLGGGVHNNLKAVYSGDGNWTTATSPAATVTVNRAAPTLTIAGAPFSATYGGTLSAGSFTVAGAGGPAAAPGGSVTTSIGAVTILSTNGPFTAAVPVTGTALPATVSANQNQITFDYSGDANYQAASSTVGIAIARATPGSSVGLNPNPVAAGVNEAITASVTTGIAGAVPTGNVTFLDGGNAISGAVALAAGSATLNIATLTAGNHNISFTYGGDVNFAGLASGASALTVTQGAPTVSAPSSSAGATFVYGTTTNLQSTVTPANPQATGTVQFFDGATSLGTVNLVAGSATLNNVLLGGGVHNNLTAVYSGDANWHNATSPAATVTVNKAIPTLTVNGAPFSAPYGGALSAGSFTVAGAGGAAAAPGGNVATSIGGITILTSNGPFNGAVPVTGTVLPATVAADQIQISFAYSGDANYSAINTNAAIAISRATPGSSVGLNPNPVAAGVNEAITASVTTGIAGAVPTGTVTFLDGGNAISGAVALTAGHATLNISTLTAGNHNVSFTYSGDVNFANLTSGTSALNVTQGAPTVSAPSSSAGATFVYGTTTNLQSTVTPANPQATGTMQFFDGATSLGTANLVAGSATLNNVLLTGGAHNNLTAVYSGDANWHTATSPAATVTVNKATPTLTVIGAPFSGTFGGTLSNGSFSVAGAGGPAAAPTGTVTTTIGTATILTSPGPFANVSLNGTALPAGATADQTQITFAYSGDANYNTVTTNAAIAIARATPTSAVGFNPNPVAVGLNEAITASLNTAIAGAVPTGTVTFLDGGNSISGAMPLTAGSATLHINTLTAGAHSITFTYTGDTNFAGLTSGASTLNVTKGNPTVAAVTSSAGVLYDYGTTTNLLTTLTPANPLPTGSVTFFNGSTSLGTANLNGAGVASLPGVFLPTGADAITAVYAGDANWNSVTSVATTITVNRATPTFSATGSPFSAVYGGTLSAGSFTVSGVATPGVAPTGTVTVSIGPTAILTSNSPFTGNVPVTGTALPAAVSANLSQITFAYSGDTNYAPATVNGQITIAKIALGTRLTAATNPILAGTSEALTAVVTTSVAGALPIGSVTFLDGATPIPGGSNVPFPSQATRVTFNTTSLSAGDHSITFTYSGDTNFNGATSSPVSVLVFNSLVVTPPTAIGTVRMQYAAPATASGGVPPYTFSAQGLPPGLLINPQGLVSGVPIQAGSFPATFTVTDSIQNITHIQATITIRPPVLQISTTSNPPDGIVGVPYAATIEATGGGGTLTFDLAGGTIPPGLSFANGLLRGTPTTPGTFTFSVRVSDPNGVSDMGTFTVVIKAAPLTMSGGSWSPSGSQGNPIAVNYGCAGGVPPYRFSNSGSLPDGMSFANCTLSGTPTASGTFQATLTLTDSQGTTVSRDVTITIGPPGLSLDGSTLASGQVGVLYSATIAAKGGATPITYSADSGLPDGLSLASNGTISGTPTKDGQFSFTVTATDSSKAKATASFSVTIIPAVLSLGAPSVPGATVGVPYSATIVATGGVKPYRYSFSGLPDGLQGGTDGTITGTPATPGDFNSTVTVTDSSPANQGSTAGIAGTNHAASISASFSMTIAPAPLSITTSSAPDGVVGKAYSAAFTATGGVAPYTFSASGQPAGLSMSAAGILSGTPTAAFDGNFTVGVKDSKGTTATRSIHVAVTLPPPPPFNFSGITATLNALQQTRVSASLGSTYVTDVTVTLHLTFQPDSGNIGDPAIAFSTGGTTATLVIPAGSLVSATDVGVQTGSVAGVITITAQLTAGGVDVTPSPPPTSTMRVSGGAAVISSMTATRTSTGFTVTIVGFVTSREVTQANFTFIPAAGSNLGTTTLTVPLTTLFAGWFGGANPPSAAFGGQFTYTQTFTVTGSNTAIASVSVTLTNSLGTSAAATATLN